MADEQESFVKPKPLAEDTAVKYIGMNAKVFMPEWKDQWIEKGEVIKVTAPLAKRLLEQPANWEAAKAPKPKPEPAAKPKPETKPDEGPADNDTPEEE